MAVTEAVRKNAVRRALAAQPPTVPITQSAVGGGLVDLGGANVPGGVPGGANAPLPGATSTVPTPPITTAAPPALGTPTPAPIAPTQLPASSGGGGSNPWGALGGAAAGAALGSALFPGVGTVVGGLAGALFGDSLFGGDSDSVSTKDRDKLNASTSAYLSGLGLTPENQAQITQALGYATKDMSKSDLQAAYASYVPQLASAVLANQQEQGYSAEYNRQADARSAALQTYLLPALQQASAYTSQKAGSYADALSAAASKVDDPAIRAALQANASAVPANAAAMNQSSLTQFSLQPQILAQQRAQEAALQATKTQTAQQIILQALGPAATGQ